MDPIKKTIKVGILTISDTRTPSQSNMEMFDSSGHNLKELINNFDVIKSGRVVEYDCVRDDFKEIQTKIIDWCSKGKVDVLLSTGGTGFSPRDVTPEATLGLIQKLTPGISQAITNESLKITPMAMLSRAVSGIYERSLIVNLPGSKKAAEQCLRIIANVIPHAISLIKDEKEISNNFHKSLNSEANIKSNVPECVSKIAYRHRESPFPKISMTMALNIIKEHSILQYSEKNKIMYPTVCIFSTGDELENNKDGCIRDTNSLMIKQILEQDSYMGQIFNLDIVRDNWSDVCEQFEKAFKNADVVVTSGGVSMGEKDLLKHVLKEHFKCNIHFGRVDMKPGMPTTFVTLKFENKKKYIFCLPGNPVSAGVCTHLFLLPYLRIVSGKKSIIHSFKATLTHPINELDLRPEYKRALLKYENGEFQVSCLTNYQQSSRLLSFVGSNCLLVLPSSTKQNNVASGTVMDVILIKSINNMYVAPILQENILRVQIYENQEYNLISQYLSIIDVLNLMEKNDFILKTVNISTRSAMGYVLRYPVYSSENLPPFPASIKDGYAIKYDGSWNKNNNIFKVVQVSVAGTEPKCQDILSEKECARISTGAPLPPGADCVIQVEDTSVISQSADGTIEKTIAVLKEPKLFDNIRSIGSDISAGQCLLNEKTEMGPFEIALLRSVSCEEVCVYKFPTIHIVPCIHNSAYGTSNTLKNMLKFDNFKGNILIHPLCKKLADFPDQYVNIVDCDDIIILCGSKSELPLEQFNQIEVHLNINNCEQKISIEFSVVFIKMIRIVIFNILNCDSDSIYNCVHLFVLPFLRFCTGRNQRISTIKAKCVISNDLLTGKFDKAELDYENRDFNVTCFSLQHQSCLVNLPNSIKEDLLNTKLELDAIVTENSDSYFIHY